MVPLSMTEMCVRVTKERSGLAPSMLVDLLKRHDIECLQNIILGQNP